MASVSSTSPVSLGSSAVPPALPMPSTESSLPTTFMAADGREAAVYPSLSSDRVQALSPPFHPALAHRRRSAYAGDGGGAALPIERCHSPYPALHFGVGPEAAAAPASDPRFLHAPAAVGAAMPAYCGDVDGTEFLRAPLSFRAPGGAVGGRSSSIDPSADAVDKKSVPWNRVGQVALLVLAVIGVVVSAIIIAGMIPGGLDLKTLCIGLDSVSPAALAGIATGGMALVAIGLLGFMHLRAKAREERYVVYDSKIDRILGNSPISNSILETFYLMRDRNGLLMNIDQIRHQLVIEAQYAAAQRV